ncbi:MAG: 50S ribosomal protein L30 [Leptospirillia bacterium]
MAGKKKASTIRIQLVRSMIGSKPKLRATIKSLGFKRTQQVLERQDTLEIRGMVAKVDHWVQVLEEGTS